MKIMIQGGIVLLIRCGIFSLMSATVGMAQTAPVTLQAFTYQTGIELSSAGGPFYQVALPLQVYEGAQRADLGDIRVFNDLGETVPHTLIHARSISSTAEKKVSVPLFQITQPKAIQADEANLALDVKRQADGTLVAIPKPAKQGKEIMQVQGVIIDVSQIRKPVRSVHLETGPSAVSFHAFSIETSDDLQQWHSLRGHAQLVHLRQDGQVIDKDNFDWEGSAGKYVRILWDDPDGAPSILHVSVTTTESAKTDSQVLWTEPIAANVAANNNYDYPIPTRLPFDQIRIGLPQVNTLVPLQVQRYVAADAQHQHGVWQTLTRTVAYRLQSPQGEIHSPDLVLNSLPADRLRLSVDASSGGIGHGAPTLQVGFVPQTLVFLARGQGPFTLAWGGKDIDNASMVAENLLPNYSASNVLQASPATLKPIAVILPNAISTVPPAHSSKGVLWAALIAGLLVLAGMVLMLVKQIRQGQVEEK